MLKVKCIVTQIDENIDGSFTVTLNARETNYKATVEPIQFRIWDHDIYKLGQHYLVAFGIYSGALDDRVKV